MVDFYFPTKESDLRIPWDPPPSSPPNRIDPDKFGRGCYKDASIECTIPLGYNLGALSKGVFRISITCLVPEIRHLELPGCH